MIVSHKYRFIFLRTEKTGSTSLRHALQSVLGDEDMHSDMRRPSWAKYSPIHHGALKRTLPRLFGLHSHATASQVRAVLGSKVFDSYFKFAVERNPWDRQVSLYTHREWKNGAPNPNFDRDMQSIVYRSTQYVRLKNWQIYAIGREVVADRVLRYERLDEDLRQLFADLKIDAPIDLPRLRSYVSDRPHYSSYYSDRTREMVANWYRNEIDAFGYRFETPGDAIKEDPALRKNTA